jgi:D-arabinose 1-dehydrogenase-like Zn-dependent alcohol dehydrogenase
MASPSTSVANARFAVEVPPGIDPVDAAPLTCAGATTYKAANVAGIRPRELVSVCGIGGLGSPRRAVHVHRGQDRRRRRHPQ